MYKELFLFIFFYSVKYADWEANIFKRTAIEDKDEPEPFVYRRGR